MLYVLLKHLMQEVKELRNNTNKYTNQTNSMSMTMTSPWGASTNAVRLQLTGKLFQTYKCKVQIQSSRRRPANETTFVGFMGWANGNPVLIDPNNLNNSWHMEQGTRNVEERTQKTFLWMKYLHIHTRYKYIWSKFICSVSYNLWSLFNCIRQCPYPECQCQSFNRLISLHAFNEISLTAHRLFSWLENLFLFLI